jgi:hypothetical protein
MNPRDTFDPNRDLDDRDDTTSETAVQTAGTTQVAPVPMSGTEAGGTRDTAAAEASSQQSADTASGPTEHTPGMPGDGAGRRDQIGGKTGVYPFNDAPADLGDAPVRTGAEWGQGERGPEGYNDAGTSEGSRAATAQELLEDENAG